MKIFKNTYLMACLAASLLCPITASAQTLPMVSGVTYDGTQINWDPLEAATGYNVHYFTQDSGWSYLTTVGNVTNYVPEATGPYIIVGYDNVGNFSPFQINGGSDDTNTVDITSTPPVTDTPTGQIPIVTGVSFDGANITWDALSEATGYNVYFAAPGAGWVYTDTIGNSTSYTPELTGTYLVVGYDDAGNFSPFQIDGGVNDTNFSTVRFADIPAGQLGFVTGASFDGTSIMWDALDGAAGYNVYIDVPGIAYSVAATIRNATSYTPEQAGDYLIVGFDDAGNLSPDQINGGATDIDDGYVNVALTPSGLLGIVTRVVFDGANIKWDTLSGATGYNVHYFYEDSGWQYLETVGNVTSFEPQMTGSYIIVGYDDAGNYGPFQINGGANSNAIDI